MRLPIDRRKHQCSANEQGNLIFIKTISAIGILIVIGDFTMSYLQRPSPKWVETVLAGIIGGVIGFLQKSPERGVNAGNVEHMDVNSNPPNKNGAEDGEVDPPVPRDSE